MGVGITHFKRVSKTEEIIKIQKKLTSTIWPPDHTAPKIAKNYVFYR